MALLIIFNLFHKKYVAKELHENILSLVATFMFSSSHMMVGSALE